MLSGCVMMAENLIKLVVIHRVTCIFHNKLHIVNRRSQSYVSFAENNRRTDESEAIPVVDLINKSMLYIYMLTHSSVSIYW